MAKKLYVGNLPFSVTDQDLKEVFTHIGTVASARVITDRRSGRSKGFGFVEMTTDEDAKKAIEELGGAELNGRAITVSEAKAQEEPQKPGEASAEAPTSENQT